MTISIIVPLYYGKKHLNSILTQVEACVKNIKEVKIELILYNDCPDEVIKVEDIIVDYEVKVLNPGFNSGIHGARVYGLENATGEYVLFLDQDDKIAPTYLLKQLECIGDADAVVCRAIRDNKLHYTNTHVFEEVVSKDFMLKKWNPIISPGQVLIKKSSIPQIWKDNILKNNGADDYFLWLLMASENKVFALNQDVLYEHIVTGENVSDNTNKMMDSEAEIFRLLKDNKVFSTDVLDKLSVSLRRVHIKELDNYRKTFFFLQKWNSQIMSGNNPLDFFYRNFIKKIAIYGAGVLGKNIEMLLYNSDIEVCFYIDQNAEFIISEIPVYKKENMPDEMDAIILTLDSDSLKSELEAMGNCAVYVVNDLWS